MTFWDCVKCALEESFAQLLNNADPDFVNANDELLSDLQRFNDSLDIEDDQDIGSIDFLGSFLRMEDLSNVYGHYENTKFVLSLIQNLSDEQFRSDYNDIYKNFELVKLSNISVYNGSSEDIYFHHYISPNDINKTYVYYKHKIDSNDLNGCSIDDVDLYKQFVLSLMSNDPLMVDYSYVLSSFSDGDNLIHYCKYNLLLSGLVLHKDVFKVADNSNFVLMEGICPSNSYSQYSEIYHILSEVNSKNSVLDEFLSCYHVLENYMMRARIVCLMPKNPGMINIRQLTAIYKNELSNIVKLFDESWDVVMGGVTLYDFSMHCAAACKGKANYSKSNFYDFLNVLEVDVKLNGEDIDTDKMIKKCIPTLIYKLRCAIVHNKETEYHISNKDLIDDNIKSYFVDLCIPIMKRIAFGLPSVIADPITNIKNPIQYPYSELKLHS